MSVAVPPSVSTKLLRRLAALTLTFAFVAAAIYGWRVHTVAGRTRLNALAEVDLRASQLAAAVAGHLEANIHAVDFALTHLRDEYLERHSLDVDVRSIYESFPADSVAQIGIIGADGYLAWSSVGGGGRIYLGDREHFRIHADQAADRLFISRPVLGRASGTWSIQFSRPILVKGKFAGVIVLSMTPAFIVRGHDGLGLGAKDTVAVLRSDGSYLARTPQLADSLGKTVPADRPFLGENPPRRGAFRQRAAFDAVERTYGWHRVGDYPLVVNVGIDEGAVLAPVEEDIGRNERNAFIGSLLMLLLAAGVAFLLRRSASQQEALAASEMRHRAFFEKNTSVKLLVDPDDGRILDANPAAAAYYGYPHETLTGLRITDINCLPPEEVKAEMALAKSERRQYFNFRHRLASGDVRDVEVYSGPVDVDGRRLLFSIVHDVTARHVLERKLAASETLHRSLFQTMAEGAIVVQHDGRIAAWNQAALSILGVDEEGLQNRKVTVLNAEGETLPVESYPTQRAARGEQLDHALYGVRREDGKCVWTTVSSRPLDGAGGTGEAAAVLSFSDITPLVEAEESLRLAQSVFDVAGEGIMVTDADSRIIAVNPAFTRLTGYPQAEVLGKTPSLLASGQHSAAFYAAMWQRLLHDGHWEGEICNHRKDGSSYVEWLRITMVPERPGHGRRYVALFSDITERKREAEAVWHQANFDNLTGLPNRKLLEDRLKRAVAQAHRKHTTVALLFIDLDRFKPVNDRYGHAAGDELLRQVARRLEHCLRDEDTVARVGGDEFVAMLPDLRLAEAPTRAAEKIVAVLSEPFRVGEHFVEISCCVGVALFPKHADSAETLIGRADAAMYAAKEAGRATWRSA